MYVAKLAISSTSPSLPVGILDIASLVNWPEGSNLEKAPSVYIGPGAMQFIRIPLRPHSTARDLSKIRGIIYRYLLRKRSMPP